MSNLTISIPHQLPIEEVKRRIQSQMTMLRQQKTVGIAGLEERWNGNTLSFEASALGQTIAGTAVVDERKVDVDVTLPWLLKMLGQTLKSRIENQGRLLLSRKTD